MTVHEKIEYNIQQIEKEHEQMRSFIKKFIPGKRQSLREYRLYRWRLMCLQSYINK